MLEDFPEKRHNTLKINAIEHDLSEWHSKGQEFDSPMLHKKVADSAAFFCFRGLEVNPFRRGCTYKKTPPQYSFDVRTSVAVALIILTISVLE